MAKQKLKNTRKSAGPARLAASDMDIADRRGGIKAPSKRKNRPRARPADAPGKGKAKARKGGAEAPQDAASPLVTVPEPARAVRSFLAKVGRRPGRLPALERLEIAIDEVRHGARTSPRTRKLQTSGTPKMAQKVIEEAGEVAIEAIQGNKTALVAESVDLLYNLLVLLSTAEVPLSALWAEMERREMALGMAEKLPKAADVDA